MGERIVFAFLLRTCLKSDYFLEMLYWEATKYYLADFFRQGGTKYSKYINSDNGCGECERQEKNHAKKPVASITLVFGEKEEDSWAQQETLCSQSA